VALRGKREDAIVRQCPVQVEVEPLRSPFSVALAWRRPLGKRGIRFGRR
jgi:hypothetical protein